MENGSEQLNDSGVVNEESNKNSLHNKCYIIFNKGDNFFAFVYSKH